MNPNMIKTKFTHNSRVIIKTGYYRGYKAKIIDYKTITIESTDIGGIPKTNIEYRLLLEGVLLKEEFWIPEEAIFKYNKYLLF